MPTARLARALHGLFDGTLVVKAAFATLEALAGAGLWLTPNASVHALVGWLTRTHLAHHPGEWPVQWLVRAISGLSVESQHFYAFYLLFHGILKIAMVVLLARRVRWAYPAAAARSVPSSSTSSTTAPRPTPRPCSRSRPSTR